MTLLIVEWVAGLLAVGLVALVLTVNTLLKELRPKDKGAR